MNKKFLSSFKNPNCFQCLYLKITSNPHYPRACSMFGFKGQELPSITVKKTTGEPCQAFKQK